MAALTRWYTPAEALIMATSTNAELLALSGFRNPYPGKLGVVEEGALADLLVVDGNPLENLNLVGDPGRNFSALSALSTPGTPFGRRAEGFREANRHPVPFENLVQADPLSPRPHRH